jgi:hypothetical protein
MGQGDLFGRGGPRDGRTGLAGGGGGSNMNFGQPGGSDLYSGDARGGLGPIDPRQLQNNAQQYAAQLEAARRALQQGGVSAEELRQLDDAIRGLRELSKAGDPIGRQQLLQESLEKIKGLEFNLRKKLDSSSDALYLAGADEAPAEFRPMVEEYTRRLSRPAPAAATTPDR